MSELDRIRWNCRRGMLELDLILEGFLERHLDQLDSRQLEILDELLGYPDNDLLDLLMGRAELTDLRCAPMLEMMRAGR
jgi:antitoxin CptB